MERTITNTIPRAAPNFFRGRQESASGLIPPSPEKGSLRTSKEKVFLHRSAVHFSTGTAVQFSPGIYKRVRVVSKPEAEKIKAQGEDQKLKGLNERHEIKGEAQVSAPLPCIFQYSFFE